MQEEALVAGFGCGSFDFLPYNAAMILSSLLPEAVGIKTDHEVREAGLENSRSS